jgi:hypothetical protein
VELVDATRTLPRGELFHHQRTGSVGPFADWFRYRLLHAEGGVWVDTDVVCLKPLDFHDEFLFGWEDQRFINTAILGLPAGHALAAWMADSCANPNRALPYDSLRLRARKWIRRSLRGDRRNDIRWGEYGPKGFTAAVRHFGLTRHAKSVAHFYPIPCDQWQWIFNSTSSPDPLSALPNECVAVHLWHAMMHSKPGFQKNGLFPVDSPFEVLWSRYAQNLRDT